MTNTEWLRKRLLKDVPDRVEDLNQLYQTEWSKQFEDLMRNRLVMGRFRYAPMQSARKGGFDNIGSAKKRIVLYEQSGNLEHLVDVANLCMIEFVHGLHPNTHFAASDDGEHVPPKG